MNKIKKPEERMRWYNYVEYVNFIVNTTIEPTTKLTPWTLRWKEPAPDLTTYDLQPLKTDYIKKYGNISEYFKGIDRVSKELRSKALKNIERHTIKKYEKYLKKCQSGRKISIGSIVYIKRHGFDGNKRKPYSEQNI